MAVEKTTDIYGLALFGIWTVLLLLLWAYILYDRRKSRNPTRRQLRAPTSEKGGSLS